MFFFGKTRSFGQVLSFFLPSRFEMDFSFFMFFLIFVDWFLDS